MMKSKCEHGNFVPAINGVCKDCRITELEAQIASGVVITERQTGLVTENLEIKADNTRLRELVAELAKDRAFYRSCALSGEVPEAGSEPSAQAMEGE